MLYELSKESGEVISIQIYEFTDCIALAWSDDFVIYDDYGYTYSYNLDGIPHGNFDACTLNRVSPDEGVAYDVDFSIGKSSISIGMSVGITSDIQKASPDYVTFDY